MDTLILYFPSPNIFNISPDSLKYYDKKIRYFIDKEVEFVIPRFGDSQATYLKSGMRAECNIWRVFYIRDNTKWVLKKIEILDVIDANKIFFKLFYMIEFQEKNTIDKIYSQRHLDALSNASLLTLKTKIDIMHPIIVQPTPISKISITDWCGSLPGAMPWHIDIFSQQIDFVSEMNPIEYNSFCENLFYFTMPNLELGPGLNKGVFLFRATKICNDSFFVIGQPSLSRNNIPRLIFFRKENQILKNYVLREYKKNIDASRFLPLYPSNSNLIWNHPSFWKDFRPEEYRN